MIQIYKDTEKGFPKKLKDMSEQEILEYIANDLEVSVDRIDQIRPQVIHEQLGYISFHHGDSDNFNDDEDYEEHYALLRRIICDLYNLYIHSKYLDKILNNFKFHGNGYTCPCKVCQGLED